MAILKIFNMTQVFKYMPGALYQRKAMVLLETRPSVIGCSVELNVFGCCSSSISARYNFKFKLQNPIGYIYTVDTVIPARR